jgi:hypothetical protein
LIVGFFFMSLTTVKLKFFIFKNKNVDYINKFIFYFFKKSNYKLKIYGINNKT